MSPPDLAAEMPSAAPVVDDQNVPLAADRDSDLLARFEQWSKRIDAHWGEWEEEAKLCFDFEAGHQWSVDEIAEMEEKTQIPVQFNLTGPTIDAVSGAEIQNRQQVQYFPREVGDTGVSDALTQGAEYINDECNGDQEDSQAFRDTLVCGIGWTETRPEVEGDEASIIKERVDPLELRADPSSRKACFEDARYLRRKRPMSREAFEDFKVEIGRPDIEGMAGDLGDMSRPTVVDPARRYTNGMLGNLAEDDEVIVCEWQWWEYETVHLTGIPKEDGTVQLMQLTAEQHDQAQAVVAQVGQLRLQSTTSRKKVFYRAWTGDQELLAEERLRVSSFTYKAITGKRDRNKGTWYGLVRAMMDPQRFSNKLYSLIIHIVRSNAKGGIMAEKGAVDDVRQFEESYSSSDEITWLPNGALSNGNGSRIAPKTATPVPAALFQLMEWAADMVRKTTGVNEEILGLAGREQPGVLENQRKQAAYGILSPFFDAERRYKRGQGKLLLETMQNYLPQDKLLRIVDKGTQKYVPMAMLKAARQYDVIVDEAPAGPNQKAKNMAVLTQLMPWLSEAGLDNEFWSKAAEYTDFSAAFAQELAAAFKRKDEQEAAAAKAGQPLQERAAEAAVAKDSAQAEQYSANADLAHARAAQTLDRTMHPSPMAAQPQEIP